MVTITDAELWAFNVLNNSVRNAREELQRAVAARDSHVQLLEGKYNARFDPATGQFLAKDGDEGKEAAKEAITEKKGRKR